MKIRKVPASWLDAPLKRLMATDERAGKREGSKIKGSERKRSKPKNSGKPAS
jgi:hypothetical protein